MQSSFAIFTAMANGSASSRLEVRRYYLKEWRKSLKMSRKDVADRLGVSTTTLYRWENWEPDNEDMRLPTVNDVIAYADAIGKDAWLMMVPPAEVGPGERVNALPPALQNEATGFIEYLESRVGTTDK